MKLIASMLFLLLACASLAQGAGWTVGVIVSSSGAFADVGRPQAHAAERAEAALARSGVFGQPFRIDLRDDAGDPARAAALAAELAETGAVAVVCCTTSTASARVADVLHAHLTVHLALAELDLAGSFWSFGLAPDERTRLTAIAVDAAGLGKASLGLMTLDTPFGDAALAAFERALADTGRTLAATARYPAGATALTPEGLWMATREPGAVVIWGLPSDLPVALDGLRRRGYLGPIYARPAALDAARTARLAPAGGAPTYDAGDPSRGVRTVVAPATLAGRLASDHPHANAVAAFVGRALGGDPAAVAPAALEAMARVDDALVLLVAAFEGVAALGLGDGIVTRRLATRDALVSAPLVRLAAGAYDATEDDLRLARWQGLAIAAVE